VTQAKSHKTLILHPFLFAVYPISALLAFNIEITSPSDAVRPLILSLIGATAFLLIGKLLLKDWYKAGLFSTLTLVLFFSYGHIYNKLETLHLFGISIGRHRIWIPVWLFIFVFSIWWVNRKSWNFQASTKTLNIIAVFALVLPLFRIGEYQIKSNQLNSQIEGSVTAANLKLPSDNTVPDIYYIILDGYARDDILNKFYQLDNSDFLDDLNQLGFYIAYCSQSNYAQTQLSLASSLNTNYLENLNERYNPGNTSRLGLPELIKNSIVRQTLENLGYKTFAFDSGYDATRIEDADQYYSPKIVQDINDFEDLFIRTTFARVVTEGIAFLNFPPDWEKRDQVHRDRILYTLEKLREIPAEAGPKFVFAHIISPHWPHVFGPNGEPVHEHPDSVSGYTNQVIFISNQILFVLREIIENSEVPPIIIIQGDHGSVIESPQRRMSILNAYFLPDNGDHQLYLDISPVNTFRLIFNYYFGDKALLLEDISHFSTYEDPYKYQIIPNKRPSCP
jgi:hypothetical protein